MIQEKWQPLKGYEQLFEISTDGRIRSFAKKTQNRWGPCTKAGKMLRPSPDEKGYMKIRLWRSKDDFSSYRVHRLVANQFIPNPNGYDQVNHIDGNKANNAASNLEWCNNSLNQIHANATGLRKGSPKGKDNHLSKTVLHLLSGVYYDSAREAYNHSSMNIRFEVFCKNIRHNKNYTYGA